MKRITAILLPALCFGCQESKPGNQETPTPEVTLSKSEALAVATSLPKDFMVDVTIDERPMTGIDLRFKVLADGTSEISSSKTNTLSMGKPVIVPAKTLSRKATDTRMIRLLNQFGTVRFLELKDADLRGDCPEDSKDELKPNVRVTFRADGETHTVTHDHACRDPKTKETREAFQGLEQSLRDVADISGVLNELFRNAEPVPVDSIPGQ